MLSTSRAPNLYESIPRCGGVTLLAGWPIRSWPLFEKHQNEIRRFFAVNRAYKDNADSFVARVREQKRLLIGVLMRQDDYRIWNDGKYFFSSEQYADWMMQLTRIFQGQGLLVLCWLRMKNNPEKCSASFPYSIRRDKN
jgi:hypothetical protein